MTSKTIAISIEIRKLLKGKSLISINKEVSGGAKVGVVVKCLKGEATVNLPI